MLKRIELHNFRKHEDLVVTFEAGLNAIKGANEAGKSTIILGVLYALFGAKALPLPLADMVTWGKKETELFAKLTIEIGGRLFNFSRSKAGAEAQYDGGLVTGQNEVSSFAAEVLGGDRDLVCRLMLANQANLRGALEEGPKAVSAMIESLADFDLFDRIIDAAQQKLLLGSTATHEERVRALEVTVAETTPTAPDLSTFDTETAEELVKSAAASALVTSLTPTKAEADTAYSAAQVAKRQREGVEGMLAKVCEQEKLHAVQKAEAELKAKETIDVAELESLKQQLKDAAGAIERQRIYREMVQLMSRYPDTSWDNTKESFIAEVSRVECDIAECEGQQRGHEAIVSEHRRSMAALMDQRITSTTCPSCGQELKDKASIEARNAEIEQQVQRITTLLNNASTAAASACVLVESKRSELATLKSIQPASTRFEQFAMTYGEHLVVDFNTYPPMLAWRGTTPAGENFDPKEIEVRIVSLEGAKEAAERADARSVALAQTLKEDADHVARLNEQLRAFGETQDLDALHAECRRLGNEIESARYVVETCKDRVAELAQAKSRVELDYRLRIEQQARTKADLVKAHSELDQLNFNNTLLKKVRTARPLVADQLWGMTLAAVSTMFSSMRGEKSVVTKDKDGFSVNGKPVQGLSGSTLDILGLAIRVALIKTFLPHISFIALDEPGAGCDENRTSALLGFIASTGFSQAIVVSHEEATEAAANHIITL